jgi:hypothetical protein
VHGPFSVEHCALASWDLSSHAAVSPSSWQLPVQHSVSFTQVLPFAVHAFAPELDADEHAARAAHAIRNRPEIPPDPRMRRSLHPNRAARHANAKADP